MCETSGIIVHKNTETNEGSTFGRDNRRRPGFDPHQRTGEARGEGAVAKVRCAAITRAGGRCKSVATEGSFCWNHAPETVEARKQRASRGGRTGGNGRSSGLSEVAEAKRWLKALVSRLLKGEVERDVATAAFMGLGTLARYIELERKIREQDEIEARIAELEQRGRLNGPRQEAL